MKILVVTNLYPPHHIGGYELGCRDVVEGLRARGHEVNVLTSTFRQPAATESAAGVERSLTCRVQNDQPAPGILKECRKLAAAVRRGQPDVIYFWNLAGLSFWLPVFARWRRWRLAFFLSDTNFAFWRVAAWALGPSRRYPFLQTLLGRTWLIRGWPVLENLPCHFASEFLRRTADQNAITVAGNSRVAHWGIESAAFPASARSRWPVKKLLYVGQMIPQKGVHTALEAFALVAREKGYAALTFSLAGGGMHPEYEQNLQALAAQLGVAGRVQFLGKVPRAELPKIYADHDVLVFPSEWDEPFAITPLEAMASGLPVVGTTTGGSGELFRDRETALTFQAGDAADGARALRELCCDRELFEKIAATGQREVRAKHTLKAMVDQIEDSLVKMLKR
jgi:glycogen synthase